MDEDVLAVVPRAGVPEQVFLRARRRIAAEAARPTVPVLLVAHDGDAGTRLVLSLFAFSQPDVARRRLLPIAMLGNVGRRFGQRHDTHTHPLGDHLGTQLRPFGEHVHDDVAGHEQRGVRDLGGAEDRDPERVGIFRVERIVAERRRGSDDVRLDVVADDRLIARCLAERQHQGGKTEHGVFHRGELYLSGRTSAVRMVAGLHLSLDQSITSGRVDPASVRSTCK